MRNLSCELRFFYLTHIFFTTQQQGTMEEKVYDRQITKLAVASRVVDEMQIERHFTDAQIRELYSFKPEPIAENPETPQLPKVRLLLMLHLCK